MSREYSPFTPGQPVPVEFFVGRASEVEEVARMVRAAAEGRFSIGFLSGERGIGKSSLASFVRQLCEKEHRVLGVHVFLGGVSELTEMARRTFDRLLKESVDRPWHQKVRRFLGNHVREVGLFGITVGFEAAAPDLQKLVHDFAPSVQRLARELVDTRKAVFLVWDDINGLTASQPFAHWLKSLVDEIATSPERFPLCLLLVGLEERRQALVHLQPSLARVFHLVDVKPWNDDETREFYQRAFASINVQIDPKAMETITSFAGGLPALAHEIGDGVFRVDEDSYIDEDDAFRGVFTAADVIGRKHLEPQIYDALRSERYRRILRKLVREFREPHFKRSDVLERLTKEEEGVFDNFLRRMRQLGAIVPDTDRGQGAYCFVNRLHHLYFRMEAQRAKQRPAD